MATFNGQLRPNDITNLLFNFIISQQVFADNIADNFTLVDKAKVDGGLYGDTKLYYATDCLKSHAWGNDAEATNLLALERPKAPDVQAIHLDVFRQIDLTVDQYLSKRAWGNEDAFSSFMAQALGWIGDTKRIYDKTLYNTFIGTTETSIGKQIQTVDIDAGGRTSGENIAEKVANILTDMEDISRDYNDYGNIRSYSLGDIKMVWNSKYYNEVKKIDLPNIFHSEQLASTFDGDVLPEKYFGTVITSTNIADYSASTPAAGKPIDSDDGSYVPGVNHANGLIRSMVEKTGTVSGNTFHIFAGEEIPAGATIKASGTFEPGEVYIETSDVICKILVKYPPLMSAFEVGTSFFNPKSLTENHYLTWGHNTLEYLKNYPFVTLKAI